MRASGRDLQEVVLVEETDESPGAADDLTDRGASSSRGQSGPSRARIGLAWLYRTRVAWSPIAAGLAIAVVTNGLVAAQQERERMAALADVPGILRPLDGPVTELWRTGTETERMYVGGLTGLGGRLLLTENSMEGTTDVVALDALTGEEDWRVQADPVRDVVTDGANAYSAGASASVFGASCVFPRPEDAQRASVIACIVTDETTSVPSDSDMVGEMIVATRAHLLVIDAATGAVVSQTPTDPTSSVALLGSDLVTGQFAADGRVEVTRSGARDRTVRWTFTSPEPMS